VKKQTDNPKETYTFRVMTPQDLPRAVDLFHTYMPYSQFARFGKHFLNALFRGMVASKWSIELVTPCQGDIQGFITATFSSGNMLTDILSREAPGLAAGLAKGFPGSLKALPGALENFLYTKRTTVAGLEEELMFIVIDPTARKKGLGKALIIEILKELRARGVDTVKVSTVAGNKPVRKLLGKLGFSEALEFIFHGENMVLYTGSTTTAP